MWAVSVPGPTRSVRGVGRPGTQVRRVLDLPCPTDSWGGTSGGAEVRAPAPPATKLCWGGVGGTGMDLGLQAPHIAPPPQRGNPHHPSAGRRAPLPSAGPVSQLVPPSPKAPPKVLAYCRPSAAPDGKGSAWCPLLWDSGPHKGESPANRVLGLRGRNP